MFHRRLTRIVAIMVAIGFNSSLQAQSTENAADDDSRVLLHPVAFESVLHPDHHPADERAALGDDHVDFDGGHCDYCNGHGHEDDHDHYDFDYLQPPHHRHETLGGYPIFESLRTDHAFIERKIRVDFLDLSHVEPDNVHESDFNFELFWAINNRMAFVVEAPVTWLDPHTGSFTSGIGDLEAGFRLVAFDGEYDILTCGLNVGIPTGDPDRDLGEGHTSLEPVFLWWHDIGRGWVLQSEIAWEIPVDVDEPENEMHYNFALSRTLLGTCDWPVFHYLTPLVELNGITSLSGDESGATVIDLTPGFRCAVTEEDHAGFGFSFPISHERNFSSQFIFSFIHHF